MLGRNFIQVEIECPQLSSRLGPLLQRPAAGGARPLSVQTPERDEV